MNVFVIPQWESIARFIKFNCIMGWPDEIRNSMFKCRFTNLTSHNVGNITIQHLFQGQTKNIQSIHPSNGTVVYLNTKYTLLSLKQCHETSQYADPGLSISVYGYAQVLCCISAKGDCRMK